VELILVPVRRLFLQPLDDALLLVVVAGAQDVVLVLFQQAQVLAGRWLRPLLVVAALD
jgi:hypothetical protein